MDFQVTAFLASESSYLNGILIGPPVFPLVITSSETVTITSTDNLLDTSDTLNTDAGGTFPPPTPFVIEDIEFRTISLAGTDYDVAVIFPANSSQVVIVPIDGGAVSTDPLPVSSGYSVSQTQLTVPSLALEPASGGNTAPVAQPLSLTTDENVAVMGTVVATDADNDPLSFSVDPTDGPANGSVAFGMGGALTYTPDAGFDGTDDFTILVSDGIDTTPAAVTVTVNDVPMPTTVTVASYVVADGDLALALGLGTLTVDATTLIEAVITSADATLGTGDTADTQADNGTLIDEEISEILFRELTLNGNTVTVAILRFDGSGENLIVPLDIAAGEVAGIPLDTGGYALGGPLADPMATLVDTQIAPTSVAELLDSAAPGPDADPTDFDLLAAAVAAAGLGPVLASPDLDATVFAPDDGAFIRTAQDLGFAGSDEAGALGFIVGALTSLGGGDPIPLLTAILTYHVAPGARLASDLPDPGDIPTLQGGIVMRDGVSLVDAEPDLTDARLIETDIAASNGVVHVIDRVMLPVDIPASNGADEVLILLGDADGGRLRGGPDNDLLIDGPALDDMFGLGGSDLFVMSDDGQRDLIRDFEIGLDRIDVSAFAASLADLEISNLNDRNGDVTWVKVADRIGDSAFLLRFGDGTPLDAAALTETAFIFADAPLPPIVPAIVSDTNLRDDLRGTNAVERFVFSDDDTLDTLKNFQLGVDLLDVSAFASSFDELTVTARTNRNGDVRWLDVIDDTGEIELLVRFSDMSLMDPANLTADAFAFA